MILIERAPLLIGCVVEPVLVLLLCCIGVIGDTIFNLFLIPWFYRIHVAIFARKNRTYTHLIYLYIFMLYISRSAAVIWLI